MNCYDFAPEDAIIRHAHIVWQVDFTKHIIVGSVRLTFEKVKDTVDKVVSKIYSYEACSLYFLLRSCNHILRYYKSPNYYLMYMSSGLGC
jgi:hypothetical protein